MLFIRKDRMPAKKQIEKEKIVAAAVKIVRNKGMGALNVREIARECKCSTQPIYHAFDRMEQLKQAVGEEIMNICGNFLQKEIDKKEYPEYKAFGMGYIRFAKEEKEFFKYMFMRDRTTETDSPQFGLDEATRMIMKDYGLHKDDSVKLHVEMWAFVHGIATMFATSFLDWEWQTVSEMVTDAFLGFSGKIKGENNGN